MKKRWVFHVVPTERDLKAAMLTGEWNFPTMEREAEVSATKAVVRIGNRRRKILGGLKTPFYVVLDPPAYI